MLQLPVELRLLCIEPSSNDIGFLKDLRLVNKELGNLATKLLFSTVVLDPSDKSTKSLAKILQSQYRGHVKCVVIRTSLSPVDGHGGLELLDSFADAIDSLCIFENLQELRVKFSEQCAAELDSHVGGPIQTVYETPEYRRAVLNTICKSLKNVTTLRILSIRDLQDHMDRQFLESKAFKSIHGRLTGLHLQIATEVMPQKDLDFEALHQGFTVDLPELWLKPVMSHLTHLTLYSYTCMWGLYPFVDFREIGTFPCLESLSLGHWTIAHDWQIDWILSHGSTLKQLLLDDCTISPALAMADDDNMAHLNFPGLQPDGDDYCPYFTQVAIRWHHVFDQFQSDLQRLEHFAIHFSDYRGWADDAFDRRYNLNNELRVNRYHFFHRACTPLWLDHSYRVGENSFLFYVEGEHPNPDHWQIEFPNCHQEDEDALRTLMKVVNKRARKVT
ncbi:F-box domain protein [Stagonosporopsis vannaccii]|nr:F-box domain protein [Stagonosporopsis vannaccii]